MTGFGSCTTQGDDYVISTEIKAVNNRFLKTSIKLPEGFSGLESKIDELLHEKIARGSVNFNLKVTRQSDAFDFEVNFSTLRRYISEVFRFERENQDLPSLRGQSSVTDFLRLPGVIQDKARSDDANLSDLLWNCRERSDVVERITDDARSRRRVHSEIFGSKYFRIEDDDRRS